MEGKRIQGCRGLRKASLPSDLLLVREQLQRCGRQGRHVQGMADRAEGVRPAAVLVQQCTAAAEIQKQQAAQQRQDAAARFWLEFQPLTSP